MYFHRELRAQDSSSKPRSRAIPSVKPGCYNGTVCVRKPPEENSGIVASFESEGSGKTLEIWHLWDPMASATLVGYRITLFCTVFVCTRAIPELRHFTWPSICTVCR